MRHNHSLVLGKLGSEVGVVRGSNALGMALAGQRSGSQAAASAVRGWQGHATLFALAGSSNMCAAAITNPVNVVKVRMQLDGALSSTAVLTPTPLLC